MNTKTIPAKIELVLKECDICGSCIDLPADYTVYMTNPPKKDYLCSSCGAKFCLSEEDWPHFIMMGRKYDLTESHIRLCVKLDIEE